MSKPTLLSEMLEDNVMMVFSEMKKWEVGFQNAKTGEKVHFECSYLKVDPLHPYQNVPLDMQPDAHARYYKDKKDPGAYKNFVWGVNYLFVSGELAGTPGDMNEARKMATEYALASLKRRTK